MDLDNMSDEVVLGRIVHPFGGVSRFRLVVCPNSKLVQYSDAEGDFLDLIIEDDELAKATIIFLERSGVPEIDWEST